MPHLVGWANALAVPGVVERNPPVLVNRPQDNVRCSSGRTKGSAGAFTVRVPHTVSRWCLVSTPDETFRATLPATTPDGEQTTVIVTRQGHGAEGQVWVTFPGARVTTAVMTDEDAGRFVQLVSVREGHAGEGATVGALPA